MYNYYADIVWIVDATLLGVVILTCFVIILTADSINYSWLKRRRALLNIKKDVYELILAGREPGSAVCQPFLSDITPQQFIDISTNRRIDFAFFNESEQQFFKNCFIIPAEIKKLEKIAQASRNKWRKIEALICLGYTQTKSAIDLLKKSILSKDKDIAYFSMISLGQIKTLEAAKVLLAFLKKEPSNGYKIVSILENFPEEIADEVINLTDYHDSFVRYWAAMLLSRFPSQKYILKLKKLTEDSVPEVRAAACDCLGNIGSIEAKGTIIKCLKDDSWLVRSHAVTALAKVMKDESVPEVVKLINDASWSVVDAVRAVMAAHIEASVPYIEKFLKGDYEIAKKYAIFALADSGYLTKLLIDAVSGKNSAVVLLKDVIKSKVHSGLDAALNSLDPAIREKAVDMLVKIEET